MPPNPRSTGVTAKLYIENVPAVKAQFAARAALAARNMDSATSDAAEDLLEKTAPFVPVEEGTLLGTGRVEKLGHADYAVRYGGADAPYAAAVHENLEAAHTAPTKAKFLEETYLEHRDRLGAYIRDHALGG